jgi:hypothetical protein
VRWRTDRVQLLMVHCRPTVTYLTSLEHRNRKTDNRMNNPNSTRNPASSRATLKLKTGARRPSEEKKATSASPPQNLSKLKTGAHWSDDDKQRMQQDMDS